MSDDLFESFGSNDLFEEEEPEKQPEGEGQNKTFIIAIAALGGLLIISLILFGVWAFVINPRMQANMQPTETVVIVEDTPVEDADTMGETDEAVGEDPDEALSVVVEEEPTNTPEPTATLVVGPTRTPTVEAEATEDDSGSGGEEMVQATPTEPPRRTPTPGPTRRPTATPKADDNDTAPAGASSESLSQTGLGEVLLIVGAFALMGLALFVRRLRRL
ncbi:MAG: hypothetical protein P1S60_18385 [Anaerolineae bacterium]|nr:hypothetical protein [Anaerolineae bacterium]